VQATASWILVVAFLCAGAGARNAAREHQKKKDVPVYTDEDLRRVSPLRDQTGGGMESPPSPPAEKSAAADVRTRQGEAYWRREAERLRDRLQPWRERLDDMRAQIEERRRKPGVRPYSDPGIESLQRRITGMEQRIREAEDRLHERARRDGAMPSWLR
jgi:hypothetical protein